METIYEELIEYFKNATESDKKNDLSFLDNQIPTDVLVSDYIKQMNSRIEYILFSEESEPRFMMKNVEYSDEPLALAA